MVIGRRRKKEKKIEYDFCDLNLPFSHQSVTNSLCYVLFLYGSDGLFCKVFPPLVVILLVFIATENFLCFVVFFSFFLHSLFCNLHQSNAEKRGKKEKKKKKIKNIDGICNFFLRVLYFLSKPSHRDCSEDDLNCEI